MDEKLKGALDGLETGPGASDDVGPDRPESAGESASHPSVAALRSKFGDAIEHHEVMAGDEHVVFVPAERIVEILSWLKDEPGHEYDLLKDVTAVDFGGGRPLQVVYELWSIPHRRSLRVKALLPLHALEIDSVCGLWRSANWLEREVFDLFGIRFRGHPDLRRILMPDNYAEGHPLRKDFPLRGRFSRVEQTRRALAMEVEDHYTPEELEIGTGRAAPTSAAEPGPTTHAGGA